MNIFGPLSVLGQFFIFRSSCCCFIKHLNGGSQLLLFSFEAKQFLFYSATFFKPHTACFVPEHACQPVCFFTAGLALIASRRLESQVPTAREGSDGFTNLRRQELRSSSLSTTSRSQSQQKNSSFTSQTVYPAAPEGPVTSALGVAEGKSESLPQHPQRGESVLCLAS